MKPDLLRRSPRALLCAALLAALSSLAAPGAQRLGAQEGASVAGFEQRVRPFLEKYCVACHNADEAAMELDLSAFKDRSAVLAAPSDFAQVIARLEAGDMPPEDAELWPSAAARRPVVAWLREAVREGHKLRAGDPGRPTLRRLNRAEYNHTIEDLFGVSTRPADTFPDDDVGHGFDTVGDVLALPPLLLERYLEAGEKVASAALRDLRPLRRRIEAEGAERRGRGSNRRGFAWLSTNGGFSARVTLRRGGRYVFRARAFGDQAGRDKVRMSLRIDGRQVARRVVAAIESEPEVYSVTLDLAAGERRLEVAFVNDYYQPKALDPRQRDRNMAVDWFEIEGPTDAPPPTRFEAQVAQLCGSRARDHAAAKRVLGWLSRRALRRPVRSAELEALLGFYDRAAAQGSGFEEAMQVAISALLVSPHFLFRVELDPSPDDPKAIHPLSDHELATRLSYFLWSSLPDEALVKAADEGRLRASLGAELKRMIDDPRTTRFVEQFAGQWLQLRRLETAAPDPDRFPRFDEALRRSMRVETEMLFEAMLRENRSILELLSAPFTFVDGRLARHYGIPGVSGARFRRVRVPAERGGVLGHASILTITSNPTRSSPVKRGKWILEVLLDDPPPPPEPGSDSLDEAVTAKKGLSLRQQFELHRSKPSCAVCHARLDPLGFGLENFDGVGSWRLKQGPFSVDASGVLPGGRRFEGLAGLRAVLLERQGAFVRGFVRKLMIYGLGRGLSDSDEAAIAAVVEGAAPDYRMQELILRLCQTEAFTMRRGEER